MHCLIIVILSFIYLYAVQTRADFELLLLHSNDLRNRIEQNVDSSSEKVYGGFGRISSFVKEAKTTAAHRRSVPLSVFYLNAGDTYTDPVWRSSIGFDLMIEFLNELNPDVSCLGQHDLKHITNSVRPFVKRIKYPLIVANIHFQDYYLKKNIKPSIVLNRNNKKIGFIGYVSTLMFNFLLPNSAVEIEDEVDAVKRESKLLKSKGVDIIIALGYSGIGTDRRIASQIADVDVVVGGLTNTFLWNGLSPSTEDVEGPYPEIVKQKSGKEVPVVQTYGFAKYLGMLLLRFNDTNNLVYYDGNPIFLRKGMSQDGTILSMLNTYGRTLRTTLEDDYTLGQSIIPMTAENVTMAESNLANFVTDCMMEYASRQAHIQSATLALLNAGAFKGRIDTSKSKPNITKRMLEKHISMDAGLTLVRIKGKFIVNALEQGLAKARTPKLIHGGGLRVDIDPNNPSKQRAVSTRVNCLKSGEPSYCKIKMGTDYRFITTDLFLVNSGHDELRYQGVTTPLNNTVADAITYYLRKFGIVKPELDLRLFYWTKRPNAKSQCPCRIISTISNYQCSNLNILGVVLLFNIKNIFF